jgi:HEAT repeat protein
MIDALVAALGAPSKAARRRAAEDLIPRMAAEPAERAVRDALADPTSPERRWGAAFVLYRAGFADDAVFDGAMTALGSSDGDVRWAAAEIVVALAHGAPTRMGRLASAVRSDDPNARKMALYCLRDCGAGYETTYRAALDDIASGVRLAAIAGLARLESVTPTASAAVARVMERDADAGVRRAAAIALGRVAAVGTPARTALLQLRESTDDRDLVRAIDRALAIRTP